MSCCSPSPAGSRPVWSPQRPRRYPSRSNTQRWMSVIGEKTQEQFDLFTSTSGLRLNYLTAGLWGWQCWRVSRFGALMSPPNFDDRLTFPLASAWCWHAVLTEMSQTVWWTSVKYGTECFLQSSADIRSNFEFDHEQIPIKPSLSCIFYL